MQKWQCRIAPSLGGGFAGTPNKVWGTVDYEYPDEPTVFFGMYGLPDFYALWRHTGEKHILWAGSDIIHLKNNYWLEDGGAITIGKEGICEWINKYCKNWCENEVEQKLLKSLGIEATVVPSFLGDVNDFPLSFKPGNKVYTSVSGDNFELYGWHRIAKLAQDNPDIEFHLYGNNQPIDYQKPNIIVHGRVPQEVMDAQIKEMQGALRLTEFDGFSEIVVKSLLWGQYPISLIDYPGTRRPERIGDILLAKNPNVIARQWLLKFVNKYPWNKNQNN
jgi:hypothetical protein